MKTWYIWGVFVLSGLCEIGGGYLVWAWLRGGKSWGWGLAGALLLALYGVVATWQPASFSRAYAAYGGIFVVMALFWGMIWDKQMPDGYDLAGALVILVGVGIICLPRT